MGLFYFRDGKSFYMVQARLELVAQARRYLHRQETLR